MAYVSERRKALRNNNNPEKNKPTTSQSNKPTQQSYVSSRRQAIRESVEPNVAKPSVAMPEIPGVQPQQKPQGPEQFGELKRFTPAELSSLGRPVEKPIDKPVEIIATPKNEAKNPLQTAIKTAGDIVGKGLSALGVNNAAQAVDVATKITPYTADLGADVVKGGLSAGAEGTVRGINAASDLISMGAEGAYKLIGIDSPHFNKEQREKGREQTEKWVSDIRRDFGVDPEKMSNATNLIYSTATNIPQMLAGSVPFFMSAAGGYAQDAEQRGANLGQSLGYGLAGGTAELALEKLLGIVPGVKGLKDAVGGGVKGFIKNVAGEALEEAITEPVTSFFEKTIFNPKKEIFEWDKMGESAMGGAIMAIMMTALGLPINSIARRKVEAAIEKGEMVTTKKADEIMQDIKSEVNQPAQQPVNQQEVAEPIVPIKPTEQQEPTQAKPQETAPVKSQEQKMDEAIKQQQGIVDDLSYRKFYLEHDVEAELEAEAVKLETLKAEKEKLLADRQTEAERAQRVYDYEQGNIPLEQIMSESEIKETKTPPIQAVGQTESKRQESMPQTAEAVKNENRVVVDEFKRKHENKYIETEKNVWEMDADEYYDYLSQSREGQTAMTTAFESGDYIPDSPQSTIGQKIKAIEDRYYKNIDGYTKALYHQNKMEPPVRGYEYRNVPFQDKIDKFRAEQESLMEAEKQKAIKDYSEKAHKAMISDAVNAGKDVPQNILEKYPYLKKKSDIMKAKVGAKNEAISEIRRKADPNIETGRGTDYESIQGEQFIPTESQEKKLGDSVAKSEAATTLESKYSEYINERQELPNDPEALSTMLAEVEQEQKRTGIKIDLQHFAEKIRKKLSKVYSNTFTKSGIADELGLKAEDFKYIEKSEASQMEEANERLAKDRQGEIERILNLDNEVITYNEVNIGLTVLNDEMAKPENERDYDLINRLSQKVRLFGTTIGQAEQAFAKFSRTPAEIVKLAQKGFDDVEQGFDSKDKRRYEKQQDTKELKDGIKQAEKDAANDLKDEIMDGKKPDVSDSEKSVADLLAKRIENYITEKKPQEADILKDMVDELFKVAQESPIEGQKTLPKNKYELLKNAIKDREVYRQTWDEAKKIVQEKYKGDPSKLNLLEEYFENEPKRLFANKTIDSVIKDAISKNKIKAEDFVSADNNVRKNLVNLIMNEAGFTGNDVALFGAYLDERIQQIQKEWEQKRLERTTIKSHEQQIKFIGEMISDKLRRPFAFDKVDMALKNALADKKIKMSDIAKNYYSSGKVNQKAIVDYIVEKSGLKGQNADVLSSYLYQRLQTLRKEYNKKFIDSLIKDKPKSYNKPDFMKKVMELINTGALQQDHVKDLIRVKYGLPVLESSDIQQIVEKMKGFDSLPEGDAKEKAYWDAVKVISKKLPVTSLEKVIAWRRVSMLLNPRTWGRNIGGNAILNIVSKSSDSLAQIIEMSLPVEERTKALGWAKDKNLVEIAKQSWEENKNTVMQGSRWAILNARDLQALKPIFKNKGLNMLSEFSFNMLEAQDAFFVKAIYIDSIGQIMKARGLAEVNQNVIEYATLRAQEMTFRDPSKLATAINDLKRIPLLGVAVETALPFVKTPINITKRAMEYSPFGLIKMATEKGKTKARTSELVARATSGTAIMALGMLLSLLGKARTDREKSKNAEDLKRAVGEQANSIITPWGSYTFDWAQPVAAPLAMGISVMESIKKGNKGITKTILDAIAVGGDSILNQSVLQNIKEMLGGGYGSMAEALFGLPLDFIIEQNIPAMSGQLARSIDRKRRSYYGSDETGVESYIRRNAAKIPGASFLLEPEIDIFGNVIKQGNAIEQFLSPGIFMAKNDDPVYQEVLKIYKTEGKNTDSFLPGATVRKSGTFTVDGKEVKLTAKEYTEFVRSMGSAYYVGVRKLMKQQTYRKASEKVKANMIAGEAKIAYNNQKEKYVKKYKP